MTSNKEYIVVVLNSDEVLEFDGKCDLIDYNNNELCMFKHVISNDPYKDILLAAIPYSNIRYIYTKEVMEMDLIIK